MRRGSDRECFVLDIAVFAAVVVDAVTIPPVCDRERLTPRWTLRLRLLWFAGVVVIVVAVAVCLALLLLLLLL